MKQTIFIIGIFFLFSSCGQTDKTTEKEDLKKVTIDFAEAVIEIPDSYRLTSPDDLKSELLSSDKPNNVIQTSIQKIEKLKSMPTDFIIYADTANFCKQSLVSRRRTRSADKTHISTISWNA